MLDLHELDVLLRFLEKHIHAFLEKHIHDVRSGEHMYGTDLEKFISGMFLERIIDRLKCRS